MGTYSRASLELYSLTEEQQFSTSIFVSPNDDHIGQNMYYTSDIKIILKSKNVNVKTLTQACM
jgi:hypothetical protein